MVLSENPFSQIKKCKQTTTTKTTLSRTGDAVKCYFSFNVVLNKKKKKRNAKYIYIFCHLCTHLRKHRFSINTGKSSIVIIAAQEKERKKEIERVETNHCAKHLTEEN